MDELEPLIAPLVAEGVLEPLADDDEELRDPRRGPPTMPSGRGVQAALVRTPRIPNLDYERIARELAEDP